MAETSALGSNSVNIFRNLDHEKLRQDRDGLQVDGEGPQDLQNRELLASVEDQRQEESWPDEKLDPGKTTELGSKPASHR